MKLAVPVAEAADLIGCSTSMLWKLIAQGDIARAKVGRRTVIRIAELERFLADAEDDDTKSGISNVVNL
jgi:excisionase family DNA binding protein